MACFTFDESVFVDCGICYERKNCKMLQCCQIAGKRIDMKKILCKTCHNSLTKDIAPKRDVELERMVGGPIAARIQTIAAKRAIQLIKCPYCRKTPMRCHQTNIANCLGHSWAKHVVKTLWVEITCSRSADHSHRFLWF